MEELIKTYDEYLEFLNNSNQAPVTLAHVHGWRCDDETFNKGVEFRDKIQQLKEKLLN